jgi:integration host factor subunit alpha
MIEFVAPSQQAPVLTKAQLAELLFEQIGLNKRESKEMVDAFFDLLCERLAQADSVKFSGFGTFHIRSKPAGVGRNPHTGQTVVIAPRRVVVFQACGKLKEQVQDQNV